jgi:hypothetical protein
MKCLLGAHVESSYTVLRYMGGIVAQTRSAQMLNRKLSLLILMLLFAPTPEERSINAKPSLSTRPISRHYLKLFIARDLFTLAFRLFSVGDTLANSRDLN